MPDPFIMMYGHHDGAGVTSAFRDIIGPFNVVEGTSDDASFIKELRNQGRVYAAHVNNPSNESATQLLARWRAPFENTLGGQLPGGYDAIAIDELHGANTNGTAHSNAVVSALQQLRNLYPDKGIYVATTWQYGQNPANYTDQLNALNDYADRITLEVYIREGNPSYGWLGQHHAAYAGKLAATVPGIIDKTVYGLYISQGGYVADDTTNIGFWGHLDEQFHRIRNDPVAATMPGLMFWVYYRSQQDVTPDYVARLVDHYYIKNNTSYFGDGSTKQFIGNAQFDGGTSGWNLQSGLGGTLNRFNYNSVSFENDHDNFGQTSHGSHGLKMVRGSGANEASYRVSGIDPGMVYTVSAWVYSQTSGRRATVKITDADGNKIDAMTINHVGSSPDYLTRWNEWSRIIFNFSPTSSTIDVVLGDESASYGTTLYWDFVELEEAYPRVLTNRAPTKPSRLSTTSIQPDGATVTWDASTDPDGDGITYELQYRKEDLSDPWSNAIFTSQTRAVLEGLGADTVYRAKVRATDGNNHSGWEKVNQLFDTGVPTNRAPIKPSRLSTTSVQPNGVTVTWDASMDPDSDDITYELQYRKENLSDPWSDAIFTSQTAAVLEGLEADTVYRAKVRATDGNNHSGWEKVNQLFDTGSVSSNTRVIGEVGQVTDLTHELRIVTLSHTFSNPVIFTQSPSYKGGSPITVRVTDVQTDQFTVYLSEPSTDNGQHRTETISYLVLEAGSHKLADGRLIEVGTVDTDATTGIGESDVWETVSYDTPFPTQPVVLTQIQTDAGVDYLHTRQKPGTKTEFTVALQQEEAATTSHGIETIGYLAAEAGTGWSGLSFEAITTDQEVTDAWHTVQFNQILTGTPNFLSSLATTHSIDSANLRYRRLKPGQVDIRIREDTTADEETTHRAERVSYLAIGGDGLILADNTPMSPTAPSGLAATVVNSFSAVLQWSASMDANGDLITYKIQFRRDDTSTPWSDVLTTTKTSLDIIGLDADAAYRVKSRASDGELQSEWVQINRLFKTAPVHVNPVFTATDLSQILGRMGSQSEDSDYSSIYDFDTDGTIAASDLSYLLHYLGG